MLEMLKADFADLLEIAIRIWRACPDDPIERRRRLRVILKNDLGTVMVSRYHPQAVMDSIARLFQDAESEVVRRDAADAASGRGQSRPDIQVRPAPAGSTRHAPVARQGEATRTATSSRHQPSPPLPPPGDRVMRRLEATLRFQARCCLDDFLVDGRPIGDLTVSEVRVWIARRERDGRAVARDVRFAKALISGLPGNVVVRDMVKQQDADQYLANAEAEHAQ